MSASLLAMAIFLSLSSLAPPAPQTVALEGQVLNDHGSPAFVWVMVVTADKKVLRTAVTDVKGRYAIADAPVGDVEIIATKGIADVGQTARMRVRLAGGETNIIDVPLPEPLLNFCNCACPFDPRYQWNGHEPPACSPCKDCGYP